MRAKVILDRAYSFSLVAFVSEAERQRRGIDLDLLSLPLLDETISVINHAAILYDKILIEKSYATSIEKMLDSQSYDWFWEIFEPIDLWQQDLGTNENLVLADDLRLDLQDKEFLRLADKYYVGEKSNKADPTSAIKYVHLTMKAAKALDADIIPWPSRFELFSYKFSKSSSLYMTQPYAEILETILEVDLPSFNIKKLSQVLDVRKKPEIRALRSLTWQIRENLSRLSPSQELGKDDILKEYIKEHRKLIEVLAPDKLDVIQMIVSWLIPFPFDVTIDSLYEVSKLLALREFRWFFLLRQFSTNEQQV